MPETVTILVNGRVVAMPAGATVGAAMLASRAACRTSVSGEPRTALCGMGICFECRAVVNGILYRRTCQLVCESGMTVETQP